MHETRLILSANVRGSQWEARAEVVFQAEEPTPHKADLPDID